MDNTLIDNWNKVVRSCDVVYHLGDFVNEEATKEEINYYLNSLNGRIVFIYGNHDNKLLKVSERFENIYSRKTILVGKQKIILRHKALSNWKNKNIVWHLHGHSHGNLPKRAKGIKICDVGVECWNYKPVTMRQLKRKLGKFVV